MHVPPASVVAPSDRLCDPARVCRALLGHLDGTPLLLLGLELVPLCRRPLRVAQLGVALLHLLLLAREPGQLASVISLLLKPSHLCLCFHNRCIGRLELLLELAPSLPSRRRAGLSRLRLRDLSRHLLRRRHRRKRVGGRRRPGFGSLRRSSTGRLRRDDALRLRAVLGVDQVEQRVGAFCESRPFLCELALLTSTARMRSSTAEYGAHASAVAGDMLNALDEGRRK